ncbi:MAG: diguanylate cyclase [Myxococcales bacterium]|nr:diguanylate cyclase [Myxococcales bacterium]
MQQTVLVADQNTQFLDQTRFFLEQQGFNFLQSINGEEAKLKLEHDQVDFFLVNVDLPLIDGPTLCEFVRKELGRPCATALMVSQGHPMPSPSRRNVADSLLIRPLQPRMLLTFIQNLETIRRLTIQNLELKRRLQDPNAPVQSVPVPAPVPVQAPIPEPVAVPTPAPIAPAAAANDEPDGPLYPMKWFRKLATLEVKRAIRFHQPLSLLLMAYDYTEEFLQGNGEETLEMLSNELGFALRSSIRAIDIPVQFSRDHLLILLPNTGIEGAIRGATRVKNAIYEHLRQGPATSYGPPTISIGATTSPTQGDFKFTDLLRDATRALREVRLQGGDGVFYC